MIIRPTPPIVLEKLATIILATSIKPSDSSGGMEGSFSSKILAKNSMITPLPKSTDWGLYPFSMSLEAHTTRIAAIIRAIVFKANCY